jgi:hypothetical protein
MSTLVKSQTPELVAVSFWNQVRHLSQFGTSFRGEWKNRLATTQNVSIYSTVRSGTYLKPLEAQDLQRLIISGTHCAHIAWTRPNSFWNSP